MPIKKTRKNKMNTFDDWFNETENFALRSERFYSELSMYAEHPEINPDVILAWVKAAYEVGYKHGRIPPSPIGKFGIQVPIDEDTWTFVVDYPQNGQETPKAFNTYEEAEAIGKTWGMYRILKIG
jgi:hypothetical protein